jgi:hypothetical protein
MRLRSEILLQSLPALMVLMPVMKKTSVVKTRQFRQNEFGVIVEWILMNLFIFLMNKNSITANTKNNSSASKLNHGDTTNQYQLSFFFYKTSAEPQQHSAEANAL